MGRLTELIERVRNATAPDRDLDYDIGQALGWDLSHPGRKYLTPPAGWPPHKSNGEDWFWRDMPRYTASLDATKAEINRQWGGAAFWSVCCMEEGPFAQIIRPMPDGGYINGVSSAYGNTEELTLLAAFLTAYEATARAALQSQGGPS